ncbi:hypothetical protein TNCV_3105531 [Trichonephila clavipes]|nr:hypothetical protein TNCV_3105531 [Trichonephila clavipes]
MVRRHWIDQSVALRLFFSPSDNHQFQKFFLGTAEIETTYIVWNSEIPGVRRGRCQLRCRPRHLTVVQNDEVRRKSPRVPQQYDVNIHSLILDCTESPLSKVSDL